MNSEKALGLIALGWLIGAVLLATRLIRKGRELAEALAMRHPETYEALGRPQPSYLQSIQGSRFARFIAQREYENLGDPALAARFEDYRRAEARFLLLLLASLAGVGFLALAVRHTT